MDSPQAITERQASLQTASAVPFGGFIAWNTGDARAVIFIPDQFLRTLSRFEDRLVSMEIKIDELSDRLEKKGAATAGAVEQDPLAAAKSLIVRELSSSEEPIYPGTIALKYNLDFQTVQKAIKELRDSKILE